MAQFQVEQVPDDSNVVQHPASQPLGTKAAIAGILLGLKALSQGAAIALSNIARHVFALLTVGSTFWLSMSIPTPTTNQLILIAMYAGFILASNVIVWRK